jgi:hypothetical protein
MFEAWDWEAFHTAGRDSYVVQISRSRGTFRHRRVGPLGTWTMGFPPGGTPSEPRVRIASESHPEKADDSKG